jgi:hypothetical protein
LKGGNLYTFIGPNQKQLQKVQYLSLVGIEMILLVSGKAMAPNK